MPTIFLLITLMTPKGDVTLIVEPYPTPAACEVGRVNAIKAVERKPAGFIIRDATCNPSMDVTTKAMVKATSK